MQKLILFVSLLLIAFAKAQTTDPMSLVNIQKASQSEIDAYDPTLLEIGMLVYNTDKNRIYEYTDQGFLEILTSGNVHTGFFIISGNGVVTVSGIPFEPSQVTFVAHANVESLSISADNGVGDNARGIYNSFGTMNGFVNNSSGTLQQQVIYVGGHGNSINDISRYASSAHCIGIRYGDQNGRSLGRISGAFDAFTADGFTINVTYVNGVVSSSTTSTNLALRVRPDDVQNEDIVVLYTAYR